MTGFWDSNHSSENSLPKAHRPSSEDDFFSDHGARTNLLDDSSQNMEQYMWYLMRLFYKITIIWIYMIVHCSITFCIRLNNCACTSLYPLLHNKLCLLNYRMSVADLSPKLQLESLYWSLIYFTLDNLPRALSCAHTCMRLCPALQNDSRLNTSPVSHSSDLLLWQLNWFSLAFCHKAAGV